MRRLLLVYSIFFALQLASAALLYLEKVGFHPAQVMEAYRGSEAMLVAFPDREDRFRSPRTFSALLGLASGHFLAFGLCGFVFLHWFKSSPRPQPLWPGQFFLLLAFMEAAFPLLVRYGFHFFIYLRPVVFLSFMVMATALLFQMIYILYRDRKD
ncbi:MAG: hypothetical protein HS115_03390 [Spirochaetales bacterium]|nr:hypothetical protein [Spirochaetales bacterium]